MRIFESFEEALNETIRELFSRGRTVFDPTLQGRKVEREDYEQKELIGYAFTVVVRDLEKDLQKMLDFARGALEKDWFNKETADKWVEQILNYKWPEDWYKGTGLEEYWKKFGLEEDGSFSYCVTPDTKVLLADGQMKEIRDIKEGDFVVTMNGVFPVIRKFTLYNRPIVKVVAYRGFELKCTPNHPVLTLRCKDTMKRRTRREKLTPAWIEARDLQKADYIAVLCGFDYGNKKLDPEFAYALGSIFGDGSTESRRHGKKRIRVSFVNTNKNYADRVKEIFDQLYDARITFNVANNSWMVRLNAEDSKKFKSEMAEFLRNPLMYDKKTLLYFIQGVFDSDGYAGRLGPEFCTAFYENAKLIQQVLLKLGYVSYIAERSSFITKKTGNPEYVVCVRGISGRKLYNDMEYAFKKPKIVKNVEGGHQKYCFFKDNLLWVKVKKVEPCGYGTVMDIQTNGSFISDFIVSHNSYAERLSTVIPRVIYALKQNKYMRGAVATVYESTRDITNMGKGRRVPCTMYMQWLIRNEGGEDVMTSIVTFRSQDLATFFPLDVYKTAMISKYIADKVGVKYKYYIHFTGSLHSYKCMVPRKYQW